MKGKPLLWLVVLLAAVLLPVQAEAADLKVATLHPLVTDLAENVGGDRVQVTSLLREGGDPHDFDPSPGDMARIRDARLILASGKGLETFLPRLRDNLAPGQEVFEVGRTIPSLRVEVGDLFLCCPAHSHGSVDPHWWHSIANMQRAARILAAEFSRVDPQGGDMYRANARDYSDRLDLLKSWVKSELRSVPRRDRILVTSHAAFGYFCEEFGFRALPVQGLERESNPSPAYLAEAIEILRKHRVKAVFPEKVANPKIIESMVKETGVRLGDPLIADGTGTGAAATFEGMMRHNVTAIVSALQ